MAEQFGVDKEELSRETSFADDLSADSLDVVELSMYHRGGVQHRRNRRGGPEENLHRGRPGGLRRRGLGLMEAIERKLNYTFPRQAAAGECAHPQLLRQRKPRPQLREQREAGVSGRLGAGFVVADALYRRESELPEGRMTRVRAQLVCEDSLRRVATELGLGSYIRLGRGEEHTGGRNRASILADAVEALIAAMFLDGGLEGGQGLYRAEHPLGAGQGRLAGVRRRQDGTSGAGAA